MKKQIDSKKTMLIHSEAKVEFYKKYLERYLRILFLSDFIEEINIFDIFCGTGIYDNNKKGSPIVAFDVIKNLCDEYGFAKRINLVVNDGKQEFVSSVQSYLDSNNQNYCCIEYNNLLADEMFEKVIDKVSLQNNKARNLIFIDPYGYKEIKKDTIQNLLQNGRTEIILFLPISHMQRFTTKAIQSDLEPYKPLKDFVDSFFLGNHPIKKETVSALEYINYIKQALRFNNSYFSTSYYIERDEVNYNALFFLSSHIYGFEKILEVKWQLDEEDGGGFKQPEVNPTFLLFENEAKELAKNDNYLKLETILKRFLQTSKTNVEIYEVVLRNEFLKKHANEVFKNWQNDNSFNFKVTEIATNKLARKNSFYLNWDEYKRKQPRVMFSISE